MTFKKIQLVAQIVGLVTILVLCIMGVLALASGNNPSAAALGPATLSGVSNVINYQGILRHPDGSVVSGAYTMTFSLYHEVSGGTAVHTEAVRDVVVRDGLFTVLLGDGAGNPIGTELFAQPLYVGIQVGNDAEMQPRQRIAPVPYAVQLTDGVYVDGEGDVGIGTTVPSTTLHIDSGTDASLTGHGYLVIGPTSGPNIVMDHENIIARNGTSTSILNLQPDGGDISWGGHLLGLTVSEEYHVDCMDGCSVAQQPLVSSENSMCFLTAVGFADLVVDYNTARAACIVYKGSGDLWYLDARASGNRPDARCYARCLQW